MIEVIELSSGDEDSIDYCRPTRISGTPDRVIPTDIEKGERTWLADTEVVRSRTLRDPRRIPEAVRAARRTRQQHWPAKDLELKFWEVGTTSEIKDGRTVVVSYTPGDSKRQLRMFPVKAAGVLRFNVKNDHLDPEFEKERLLMDSK